MKCYGCLIFKTFKFIHHTGRAPLVLPYLHHNRGLSCICNQGLRVVTGKGKYMAALLRDQNRTIPFFGLIYLLRASEIERKGGRERAYQKLWGVLLLCLHANQHAQPLPPLLWKTETRDQEKLFHNWRSWHNFFF